MYILIQIPINVPIKISMTVSFTFITCIIAINTRVVALTRMLNSAARTLLLVNVILQCGRRENERQFAKYSMNSTSSGPLLSDTVHSEHPPGLCIFNESCNPYFCNISQRIDLN